MLLKSHKPGFHPLFRRYIFRQNTWDERWGRGGQINPLSQAALGIMDKIIFNCMVTNFLVLRLS